MPPQITARCKDQASLTLITAHSSLSLGPMKSGWTDTRSRLSGLGDPPSPASIEDRFPLVPPPVPPLTLTSCDFGSLLESNTEGVAPPYHALPGLSTPTPSFRSRSAWRPWPSLSLSLSASPARPQKRRSSSLLDSAPSNAAALLCSRALPAPGRLRFALGAGADAAAAAAGDAAGTGFLGAVAVLAVFVALAALGVLEVLEALPVFAVFACAAAFLTPEPIFFFVATGAVVAMSASVAVVVLAAVAAAAPLSGVAAAAVTVAVAVAVVAVAVVAAAALVSFFVADERLEVLALPFGRPSAVAVLPLRTALNALSTSPLLVRTATQHEREPAGRGGP